MRNPATGGKIRRSLNRGDPVKVFRGEWVQATVVSNSEAAIRVKYSDDGQEVIPWVSGRICVEVARKAG
ncbi:hypothetical protein FHS20_004248 [Phyllobacterium endophyticum]|nr:hypothetical protein [Phyllobacterium endophyticum]